MIYKISDSSVNSQLGKLLSYISVVIHGESHIIYR